MRSIRPSSLGITAALCALLGTAACAQDHPAAMQAAGPASGCLASGDGNLQAALRGALIADIDWHDAQMQCEGDLRPDGNGLRVTMAGPLPAGTADTEATPRTLRFIFGIDLRDTAAGDALVLPTNLTVIVEGGQQLYSTRGDDKCAVENLRRIPLQAAGARRDRIEARGYCTGPASSLAGDSRILVPTFEFTALVHRAEHP